MGPGQIPFVHVITSQECQTDDERAHARNKSSIFDVLNNEFDRAVKVFYENVIMRTFNATTGARSRLWLRQQEIWVRD